MEQKNRILIVEDDTDINNLLYTALQKAGYETVQAFSGTEARMLFQMDKAGFSLIYWIWSFREFRRRGCLPRFGNRAIRRLLS